ncbi:MAG: hypothetical protein NUV67_05145, partial [archaeon]|nr:hypothetical protein [archaeon]
MRRTDVRLHQKDVAFSTPKTMQFRILVNGRELGYIQRGHRLVDEYYRRRGIFSAALSLLEKKERAFF